MGTIAGMRARFCGLVVALGVLPGLLAGCAGEPRAPVEQRGARASAPAVSVISTTVPDTPRHYVVVKGDTLYSIAFRFGVDFRQLAKANRIGAPFTIYPDQRLVLTGTAGTPVATRPPTARAAASDKAAATDKPAATGKPAATDKPAALPNPPRLPLPWRKSPLLRVPSPGVGQPRGKWSRAFSVKPTRVSLSVAKREIRWLPRRLEKWCMRAVVSSVTATC